MSLPQETLREVEQLAQKLPERIARSVVHLFRDPDGAKKLHEALRLVEVLTMEILDRTNSAVVASAPRPSTDLLRVLFEFARKENQQFSFGDRDKTITAFARFFSARNAPTCEPFPEVVGVLAAPLPEATNRMVRSLSIAREGRRDFDIPAKRIGDYVAKHITGARTIRLADLSSECVKWRNADAHVDGDGDGSKRWFQDVAKDPAWLSTLAGWFDEGIAALLLWPPLSSLLSGTTTRTLRAPVPVGPDAWSAEITPGAMQILPERAVGSGPLWEGTAEWWVMPRPADGAGPKALCPKVSWPTAPAPSAEAAARYRSQVALAWIQVGFVTEDQREALEATAREVLLPDRQSAEIRAWVRDLILRCLRGDNEARSELAPLVPDDVLARFPLDALASRRADAVFALVEDDWPVTTPQLMSSTGLSAEELADVLRTLDESQRISRRASGGDAEEIRPRWKEVTDAAKLLAELTHKPRLSEGERRLSECVVALARLLDERSLDSFESSGAEEPLRLPCELVLNEKRLRADSVELLCEELVRYAREEDRWEPFVASLPWTAPGGSVLLARGEATQDVVATPASNSRVKAMYTIETQCAALGWLTVPHADDTDAEKGDTSLWIEVRLAATDEWTRIEGRSVREFLDRLVRLLLRANRFDPQRLPVASGHSRYVLNSEPLHISGSAYLAPYHCVPGVYIETHNSRSGALSAARKVCLAMKVEVQDANDVSPDLGPALRLAEMAGVREAFERVYRAASAAGLFPRYYARSVMFAPPRHHAMFAVFLQPRPLSAGGVLNVEWAPRCFQTHLGVSPDDARAALGDERQSFRTVEDVEPFCAALTSLLAGAREPSAPALRDELTTLPLPDDPVTTSTDAR